MADLKKCPFCGSDATFRHIFENPDKCMVGCRGCDVVIDGVFPNELEAAKKWNDQVLADEIAALRAENERYKADIEAGNLVRLPGKLIAPYELNDRYWICGWDSERCTLIIQDRVLLNEASNAALEGGQHGQSQT